MASDDLDAAPGTTAADLPEGDPGVVAHDPATPDALVELMTRDWATPAPQVTAPSPSAPFAARRREALSTLFPGEWIVVPTGTLKVRANDTDYPFRPGTDFYWLTGSMEPDAVLVFEPVGDGHEVTLHLAPRMDRTTKAFFTDRRYGELWVGPRLGLESEVLLGITCAPLDELEGALKRIETAPVRVLRGHDARIDALVPPAVDGNDRDAELATALSELRLVKDEREIELLQQAVDATRRGFEDAVRALGEAKRLERGERWIEGTFWRRARVEGNDVGYGSIVACGAHACTLHWVVNDGPVRDGDLALLDMGVESSELYTADVTRTIPVSGTFSPAQREVYEAVWRAQRAAIAEVRPGADFLAPHRAAMRILAEWLVDRGILTCSVDEALDERHQFHRRYTLHGTSHMLGLDVHDCAAARDEHYRKGPLAEGYCLTVEPGLYFQVDDLTVPEQYRGIGVRIEDDVVVTAGGPRVLSEELPTEASDVERWTQSLLG